MGLNSGPVYRVADINQRLNAAGAVLMWRSELWTRGDEGHIPVSSALADVLLQLGSWKQHLTDFGEHPVKHGVVIHFSICARSMLGTQRGREVGQDQVRRLRGEPSALQLWPSC